MSLPVSERKGEGGVDTGKGGKGGSEAEKFSITKMKEKCAVSRLIQMNAFDIMTYTVRERERERREKKKNVLS